MNPSGSDYRFAFAFVPYKRTFSHVENYSSGTGPISQMSQEICNIPCKVCGAPSSGYHFGAITCEGCKVSNPVVRKKRSTFTLLFLCGALRISRGGHQLQRPGGGDLLFA